MYVQVLPEILKPCHKIFENPEKFQRAMKTVETLQNLENIKKTIKKSRKFLKNFPKNNARAAGARHHADALRNNTMILILFSSSSHPIPRC